MQLTFDSDVEAFRADFAAFLDENLPPEAEALDRSLSSSDVPEWARRWQALMFDNGWLIPGNPPEFGGRNATILQQYAYQLELSRRRVYQTYNPQGVGIIAASLISYGTAEQQQKWAVPILRAEMTASLGMSEPGAGSDLASLRTRAVARRRRLRRQRAEGVDVRRARRRRAADLRANRSGRPEAQGHQRADDSHRPARRGAQAVRVGVRSWTTSTSTRCSSTMRGCPPRTSSARSTRAGGSPTDRLATSETCCGSAMPTGCRSSSRTTRRRTALDRDRYATLVMDNQALRLLGSMALARAARGDEDAARCRC